MDDDPVARVRVHLRKELLDSGLDDRALAAARRAGTLVRVRYGAYVTGADWAGLDERGRHRVLVRAAVKQSRTPVVVSHGSAVAELGGPLWGLPTEVAQLTRLDQRAGRNAADLHQHRGVLRAADVAVRGGLSVTTPAVTVLDVVATTSTEVGLVVANHFLHNRATDVEQLETTRAFHEHRPGTLGARLVLRLCDPAVESVGESRSLYAFWRGGLPTPRLQWLLVGDDGREVRLDFAWPELGVFAEFDGRVKYGRLLRAGQDASGVVDAEKRREEMVCRITGWRCLRVMWEDLTDPDRLAWRVRSLASHHRPAA